MTTFTNRIASHGDSQAGPKALTIILALPYSSQIGMLGLQLSPLHLSSNLNLTLTSWGEYILTLIFQTRKWRFKVVEKLALGSMSSMWKS